MTTRWWWVRHAPVRDDGGRIYGQSDLEADCDAPHIFESLAQALPDDALWVTTHLTRTKATAAAIHVARGGAPAESLEIEAFAEQNFGLWQGVDRQEFFAGRPRAPHSFWYCPAHERAPGGESFADVVERVRPAIQTLTEAHAGRDIVVVAHGGTIRAALTIAMDAEPEAGLTFRTDNCGITRLDHVGGDHARYRWRVVCVNHRPWREAPMTEIVPA